MKLHLQGKEEVHNKIQYSSNCIQHLKCFCVNLLLLIYSIRWSKNHTNQTHGSITNENVETN